MCKGKLNVFGNIQQDTYKTDCVLSNKKKNGGRKNSESSAERSIDITL